MRTRIEEGGEGDVKKRGAQMGDVRITHRDEKGHTQRNQRGLKKTENSLFFDVFHLGKIGDDQMIGACSTILSIHTCCIYMGGVCLFTGLLQILIFLLSEGLAACIQELIHQYIIYTFSSREGSSINFNYCQKKQYSTVEFGPHIRMKPNLEGNHLAQSSLNSCGVIPTCLHLLQPIFISASNMFLQVAVVGGIASKIHDLSICDLHLILIMVDIHPVKRFVKSEGAHVVRSLPTCDRKWDNMHFLFRYIDGIHIGLVITVEGLQFLEIGRILSLHLHSKSSIDLTLLGRVFHHTCYFPFKACIFFQICNLSKSLVQKAPFLLL
ncbi:hypothetical protein ACJX0J_022281, partial [Zea mays]